jgi:hypothetical protein
VPMATHDEGAASNQRLHLLSPESLLAPGTIW